MSLLDQCLVMEEAVAECGPVPLHGVLGQEMVDGVDAEGVRFPGLLQSNG